MQIWPVKDIKNKFENNKHKLFCDDDISYPIKRQRINGEQEQNRIVVPLPLASPLLSLPCLSSFSASLATFLLTPLCIFYHLLHPLSSLFIYFFTPSSSPYSAFSLLSFLLEDLPPFAFTVLCIEFSKKKSNQPQVVRALGPLGLQQALVGMQGGYSPWDSRRVILKISVSIWRPRNIQQCIFILS